MKVYLEQIRIKPEGYCFSQDLVLKLDPNKTSYSVSIGNGGGTPIIAASEIRAYADAIDLVFSKLREMSGKFFEINDA